MTSASTLPSAQRGVTLIITLVMLVVVTLIAVSGLRSTTMNERMAGNTRDRQRAFQAAEAAVRTCLSQLDNNNYLGLKSPPAAAGTIPLWEDSANWSNTKSTAVSLSGTGAGVSADPRCLVETLGTLGSLRVTGRAVGGATDTVVMLQATYSRE
jgi:type IV pilus assembly protein PilX